MKVGFCGPIADVSGPARGGMQAGGRVLIEELSRRGVTVLEFPYPEPEPSRNIATKALAYAMGFPVLFLRLLLHCRRIDALHLTILYRHFIYVECLLVACLKILGKPVVLHVRPGDWLLHYQRRSRLYRSCFEFAVRNSGSVLVEGRHLLEPMRGFGVTPNYIPTAVKGPFRRRDRGDSEKPRIVLICLGRLVEEKGIEIALDSYERLRDNGTGVELRLIGSAGSRFGALLQSRYREPGVRWYGELAHDRVRETVRSGHFFLFPTRFIGENHSNALTECMAEGVVPIASDHGANAEVIGDGGVVLPANATAEDYAAAVTTIWARGEWLTRSWTCTRIVAETFNVESAVDRLLDAYGSLLGRERITRDGSLRGKD